MPNRPADTTAILDAAAAEISARGIHGATLDGVVARGGATKPTINAHFGNRQGLVDATVARAADRWAAAAEHAAADDPDAPTRAVLEATAGLFGTPNYPHVVLLALLEAPEGTDAHRHARACTERLRDALAPAGARADELLHLVVGTTAVAVAENSPETLYDAADSTDAA